ncbi:MAG: pilus assembly protein PilM [Candidatus Omnitrophota bacterium]|jgi:type IV pilus assembly protein PilM
MKEIKFPFLNFNRTKVKVGIDIGTSSVKVLALSRQKTGGFQLDFFAVQSIDGDRSKENVVETIKRAVAPSETKVQGVTIAVSGQGVVVRQVLFPKMSEGELKSALQFEAEKHIPFNISEVYIDAQVIDQNAEGNKMKVLIVASKKDLVDEYLGYVSGAELTAEAIDCDAIAVTNAFMFNNPGLGKDKTVALLNIGASMTNVCILKNETLNFTRDIPVDVKSADTLENQVRLSFDYYENQFGKGIDGIYVSGGGAKETALLQRFSQAFGFEVSAWDPVKNLAVSPKIDTQALKDASGQLAVCVGLAIRR